jgi:hypothetical protein
MRSGAPRYRRRAAGLALMSLSFGVAAVAVAPYAIGSPTAHAAHRGFSKSETLTRSNLINGRSQIVDTRHFSVKVAQTRNLRDRQEVNVSWTGAHPTGGLVTDPNSSGAAVQEYPVVLMMCHGTPSGAASKRIAPDTCWTQTPGERVQISTGSAFPPYRLDRYASITDRGYAAGLPAKHPKTCSFAYAQHWVPFVTPTGKVYHGGVSNQSGNLVCNDGIPPEEAAAAASLQPGNTTYAATGLDGKGSAKFVINTSESNASLGCSDTVPCSLVVIPIIGTSCDPAGNGVPPADRPSSLGSQVAAQAEADCTATGAFSAGQPNPNPSSDGEDLAVSGSLWWSASNWRNRIMVPLNFAPPANICSLHGTGSPTDIYGSYLMLQATQRWGPHFCLNKSLFPLQHVQTGEVEAKNLLQSGSVKAAFQGEPPPTKFTTPTIQAPTAVSGFAIVYAIDTAKGLVYTHLRLDARLLAKLLTESYPSNSSFQAEDKALWNPKTHQPNPLDLAADPEFRALNPGITTTVQFSEAAATMLVDSAGTDEMTALTTYINDDPEARAWINGKPDPWGMIVNPAYKGITLPVSSFPLLDTYEPAGLYAPDKNPCLASSPVPWLPLVAAPTEQPASITLDLQFDIAASQINCAGPTVETQKLGPIGREPQGQRFLLGLTSLGDAERYQLSTAALETQGSSTSNTQFTNAKGRSFVRPTTASLRAATDMLTPSTATGTWLFPYDKMRTSEAGKAAYPGTMLLSTDVPTSGLPTGTAKNYSQFLNFAASAGQTPGNGNGQLPAGFLPLTATNGLAKLAAYTQQAATDVAQQNGAVPSVTGGNPTPDQSKTPTPNTSDSSGTTPSSPSEVVPPVSPASSDGTTSSSGTPTSPDVAASQLSNASLGTTESVATGPAGVVFPIVLVLALICGGAAIGFWRFDRAKVVT